MNMFRTSARLIAAGALILAAMPAAQAQSPMGMDYTEMCVKAADMPKPHGESDLKGNPKLKAYCGCFSAAFGARATKALAAMQAGAKPPSLEQSNKEELELRNACRKKSGLPLAVEPK
jgi:hypothetical protein